MAATTVGKTLSGLPPSSWLMAAAMVAKITAEATVGMATIPGVPLSRASIDPIRTTPIKQKPILLDEIRSQVSAENQRAEGDLVCDHYQTGDQGDDQDGKEFLT
jgi:hypothetical protein